MRDVAAGDPERAGIVIHSVPHHLQHGLVAVGGHEEHATRHRMQPQMGVERCHVVRRDRATERLLDVFLAHLDHNVECAGRSLPRRRGAALSLHFGIAPTTTRGKSGANLVGAIPKCGSWGVVRARGGSPRCWC